MAQALGNLLGNSIKFTERGGRVALALEVDPATTTGEIRIRDSGVGVAPDILPRIFDPFVQADSSLDRSQSGLGLGLALVKSVVELHGGAVEARSDGLGKGTEFVVRVPVDAEAVGAADAERHLSDHPGHRRVLIIEDNVDAADSLKEALELDRHEVVLAYDGPEGIAKAREFKPDVVLCDIGLPGMSGYEVAKALRADETLRSARLVALTGYAQPEDLQRATESGFDGHVGKPPSLDKLEEVMRALPVRSPDDLRRRKTDA
jgi:two-component system CheB/CheR fusion protein